MALKTDYKEDIFSGNRKYDLINNNDGTISLVDVTDYTQEGDTFGADDINFTNKAIESLNETVKGASKLNVTIEDGVMTFSEKSGS